MKLDRAEQRIAAALRFEAEGLTQRAEREYRAALEIAPRRLTALNNLGFLLAQRARFDDAAQLFRRATLADPADAVSQINLAGALRELGDEAAAIKGYAAALGLDPASALARLNLANLLRSQGRLEEARPHYHQLLRQDPRNGLARWNLGALEGLAGNVQAAFALFAQHHQLQPSSPPPRLPLWDGTPLAGRRILLDANQGLGDTIMFARFIGGVRDLGGRVILNAQPELARLLARLDGVEVYAPRNQPAPMADVWFPLVDLPALPAFASNFAASAAYVTPPPSLRRPADAAPFKVGLAWAGNPAHPDDRNRSMALSTLLAPLSRVSGVALFSLQKGPAAAQADGTELTRSDLTLSDLADSAALIQQLDLVIAVDTAVLHLAAAMGRPTWALLPFAPDWRWMLHRDDSPWYPSLTLFRQSRPRDWAEVAERVAGRLTDLRDRHPNALARTVT